MLANLILPLVVWSCQRITEPDFQLVRIAGPGSNQNLLDLVAVLAEQFENGDRADAARSSGNEYSCHFVFLILGSYRRVERKNLRRFRDLSPAK